MHAAQWFVAVGLTLCRTGAQHDDENTDVRLPRMVRTRSG